MSTSRTPHAVAHGSSGQASRDRLVASRRARRHLRVVPDLPDTPAGPRPPRAGGRPVPGPGAGRPGPVRLTRRGRVVVVLFLSAVLVMSGWFVGRAVAAAATTQSPASPSVVARPGDTLWSIAVRARPDADPRATVDQIMRVNDLSSPVIQPGQRVVLPRT